jgi:hypothetical protein
MSYFGAAPKNRYCSLGKAMYIMRINRLTGGFSVEAISFGVQKVRVLSMNYANCCRQFDRTKVQEHTTFTQRCLAGVRHANRRSVMFRTFCAATALAVTHAPLAASPELYGTASLRVAHRSSQIELTDEEVHSTGIVPRLTGGIRFGDRPTRTQIQVTTAYYENFDQDRKNRWYKSLSLSQQLPVAEGLALNLRLAGSLNSATLESRSVDQLAANAELEWRPSRVDRITVSSALRRRYYDASSRSSWAPYFGVEYRRRVGNRKYLSFDARKEWIDADGASLDYERLLTGVSYSQPIAKSTSVRLGVDHRRWTWDGRFTATGENRRDSLLMPRIRLRHDISRHTELDVEFRRLIRRSNDDRFDREGNRIAATLRVRL